MIAPFTFSLSTVFPFLLYAKYQLSKFKDLVKSFMSQSVSELGFFLGFILTKTFLLGIPEGDISSIQLEAITAISPEVMNVMSQEKLEFFTKQQILRMNPKTRRIYILRMHLRSSYDMNEIAKQSCTASNKPFVLQFIVNIIALTTFI